MPDAAVAKGFPSTNDIAAKLMGSEDSPPAPAKAPAPESAQESAEPDTSALSEPPAQVAPGPDAPPVKIKIKVDGEEVEMTRADIAKQIEALLSGDKDDFGKVASFTGYLNKKSIALSEDRKRLEAEAKTPANRQRIAEEFLQEYLVTAHGDKAPEVLRKISALLNPQTSATTDLQTSPTSATINPPEGVDENDPYWQAIKATQTEASALKSQLAHATRQIEEMTKAQKEARKQQLIAQFRAEYDAASKVLPILQDDLYADIARSKVYGLVGDGGLDMATAASRVAKELQEREDARIVKYLETRKAAAKQATKKPDAAGPAISKPKPFSFKDDPDEIERRIAARLAETE